MTRAANEQIVGKGRFMFNGRACALRTLAVLTVLTLAAVGQSVISTRSGIVYYFEGTVYLGDQPLESHPGKFSTVPEGAELRTADGRAEVLLTPGVFVRIGERSAIRMIANKLSDTRVELLAGSALVDSAEPSPNTSVTLVYKKWSVHFLERGAYRIDSDAPRLWVLQGKAEILADTHEEAITVGDGMDVPFAPVLVPERSIDQPRDALGTWAEGRQQAIYADNAIAANIQDPASLDTLSSGLNSFTYFPTLGLPALGLSGSSPYSYFSPYHPGFNSIYLPGYTYLPWLLGLGQVGFPTPLRLPPFRLPPLRLPPHGEVLPLPHPAAPVSHPIPVHPTSPVGVHGGVHR